MRNNVNSPWTDERMEKLVDLHSRQWSCAQIAAELGNGITRNSVIGKLHRMGVSGGSASMSRHDRMMRQRASEDRKSEARKLKRRMMREQGISVVRPRSPRPRPKLEPLLICVDVAPRGISFADLEDGDCRYPDGEGADMTFCGHPSVAGRSYCGPHAWLTLNKAGPFSKAQAEAHRRRLRSEHKQTILEAAE
jgi:GcrA cell cycle regulator